MRRVGGEPFELLPELQADFLGQVVEERLSGQPLTCDSATPAEI